jgi:hypothetical protein
MSPTVSREDGFRFYFFPCDKPRIPVHFQGQSGEAKFWIDPVTSLLNKYYENHSQHPWKPRRLAFCNESRTANKYATLWGLGLSIECPLSLQG